MKTLAGANPDAKPDYRSQALTELSKLESKVILLNELLDNVDTARGEQFAQGDVYNVSTRPILGLCYVYRSGPQQVASILTAARPKIQGWISNAETDDPESLNTFLEINDQINSVLNRYESYKKGDYIAAANPIPPEVTAASQNDSLIDFDDAPSTAPAQASQPHPPIDDLASLFGPSTTTSQSQFPAQPLQTGIQQPMMFGMGGVGAGMHMGASTGSGMGMSMGMGASSQNRTPVAAPTPSNGFANGMGMGTPPMLNLGSRSGTASPAQLGSIRLGTPQQLPTPNYFGVTQSMQAQQTQPQQPQQPTMWQQQQQQRQAAMFQQQPQQPTMLQQQAGTTPGGAAPANGQQAQGGKDPFADLVGLF